MTDASNTSTNYKLMIERTIVGEADKIRQKIAEVLSRVKYERAGRRAMCEKEILNVS